MPVESKNESVHSSESSSESVCDSKDGYVFPYLEPAAEETKEDASSNEEEEMSKTHPWKMFNSPGKLYTQMCDGGQENRNPEGEVNFGDDNNFLSGD